MSCVLKHDPCRFLQSLHITLSCRPVDHTCLTETTAADTASLNLQGDTILSRLDMRHNWCFQFVIILDVYKRQIFDGDQVLVKQQTSAENGDIVVALVEDSATVKTFYKEDGYYRLQPENDYMDPILVQDNLQILGKVFGVFRFFQ